MAEGAPTPDFEGRRQTPSHELPASLLLPGLLGVRRMPCLQTQGLRVPCSHARRVRVHVRVRACGVGQGF